MAKLSAASEQNESGCLVYATEYMGAFARGKTMEEALEKLPADVVSYCLFANRSTPKEPFELCVVQQKQSALQVCDADSDILLDCEIPPLTIFEYLLSKELCLKSAGCFLRLYETIPSPDALLRPRRKTFYTRDGARNVYPYQRGYELLRRRDRRANGKQHEHLSVAFGRVCRHRGNTGLFD